MEWRTHTQIFLSAWNYVYKQGAIATNPCVYMPVYIYTHIYIYTYIYIYIYIPSRHVR